jgi:hypothetical protein
MNGVVLCGWRVVNEKETIDDVICEEGVEILDCRGRRMSVLVAM